jgi:hypothetical protein
MQWMMRSVPMWHRRTREWILIAVTLVVSGIVYLSRRIPLDLDLHDFADERTILGIPHCLNVISNIGFLVVGIWGAAFLLHTRNHTGFVKDREQTPYLVFFVGVALTGIGSAHYHLAPGDSRLFWDLLPMTFCFMSLVAAIIVERISVKWGLWLLPLLIAFGAASVAHWYLGELQGRGNLRFYLFVQFFPAVAIAMIVALYPPRYTHTNVLLVAFVSYALAKLFELLDRQVYSLGRVVSGHTLKHLTAGLACYWILRMLMLRRPSGIIG